MDNPILWQSLLGLFCIAAIVFAIMGGRVWRIPTVLTVVGLFIGIVTYFILGALTLKTQASWRTQYHQHDDDLAEERDAKKLLTEGSPPKLAEATDEEAAEMVEAEENQRLERGNRRLRGDLAAIRHDRGRTWVGTGKLTLPNAEMTISEPTDLTYLPKDTPVYIFHGDKPDGVYVGEFKVTDVQGTTVKLALTETLTPQQLARLAGKDGEWQLRGIMPLDNAQVFANLTVEQMKELLPQAATGLDAAAYDALINEYIADGKPAKDENSDRAFHVVKVIKESEITTKNAKGEDETKKVFTDDELTVDAAKAKELAAAGVVADKPLRIIYKRPLRNYDETFRSLTMRIRRVLDRTAQVTLQIASVEAATKAATGPRMESLTKEETGLTADKQKMIAERDVVKKYLESLQSQHAELLAAVEKQYTENQKLAAEIKKIQTDVAAAKARQASVKKPAPTR